MYLTCARMDRTHPSTRQALGDFCDMHRNIMRLFPSEPNMRANGKILYRVLEESGQTNLYITSAQTPDLSGAKWLYCGQDVRQRSLAPLLESFKEGSEYLFDLLTYPSKKVKVDDNRANSVRTFLRTPQERHAWLARQGEKCGFTIASCKEEEPSDMRGKRSTGMIVLRTVCFHGVLRVTDAALFRKAYEEGIGPEKAYGLGMLLLRR